MSILDILKPAPHLEEIQDTAAVTKKYRYWRLRTFIGMYMGYAFFYFTRKSFTFAMPALANDLGFDKSQLGILSSILALSYGLSKFVSGVISDRSNPRFFMAIGLVITGILNLLFGMSSVFILFAVIWGLNGWFQGWGWPPCAKLLTHWYSQSERGSWWSVWNTSHNIGGALIPILAALITENIGWRYAMYIPGILAIGIGFLLMIILRDTPQSLGLPPIEKYKGDFEAAKVADNEKIELSTKAILWEYVIKNKYIWILAFSYFFIYVIRQAMNDWTVLFLIETKGYKIIAAGTTIFWFEVGGFLGSLVAGWSSDFLFRGKRGPINVLFTVFIIGAVYAMWKITGEYLLVDSIVMFFVGFFIFGPQMLIGVAAAELSHKKAAGTATGFAGFFAYIGAAVAGGPLGKITKDFGWDGFFTVLFVSAVAALILLLPLWNVRVNPKHVNGG